MHLIVKSVTFFTLSDMGVMCKTIMSQFIKCPACFKTIEGEKFRHFSEDRDAIPWYKFELSKIYCPHCEIRLEYDIKTRIHIILIAGIVLFFYILGVMNIVPIYIWIIAPFIFSILFWKLRKLCIYRE